jgi:hypothetical protein
MKRPKGNRKYTDAWELTKDTLAYTKDTPEGKRLAKAYNYNVTSMKKGAEIRIKRAGGTLKVNWK